ncbi:MAG TPA: hypothetical protein VFD00_05960 [Thermoclostridium sp.]|nr:hypothetical protein [Thermoclostridium sp.]
MTFTEFNHSIFKNKYIKWFDRSGILKIDGDRRAEITLSTNGIAGAYGGYLVKIIHKRYGRVSSKNFSFNDYMDITDSTRRHGLYVGGFSVHTNSSVDWYIAVPSERNLQQLTSAIMDYIELYK